MSSAAYYVWKAKYGGLLVLDAKRLRAIEEDNAKPKRLLAKAVLDNAGLKDLPFSSAPDMPRIAASASINPHEGFEVPICASP